MFALTHGVYALLVHIGCSEKSSDTSNVGEMEPTWSVIESMDSRGAWLRAFSTSSTTWIVGGQPEQGAILKGDPITGFETFDVPNGTPLLNWADGTDTNLWVGGLNGTILQWNGSVWTDHSQDIEEAIWGLVVVDDEVLAVGGTSRWGGDVGVVYHWDGAVWSSLMLPTELSSVSNFFKVTHDGQRYWVIGASGAAMHGDDGSWTAVPTGVTQDLITVISTEMNQIEIVGGRGTGVYAKGSVDGLEFQEPIIAGINGIAQIDTDRLLVGELGYSVLIQQEQSIEVAAVTSHILHSATASTDNAYWIAVGGNLATSEDTYEGSILYMENTP